MTDIDTCAVERCGSRHVGRQRTGRDRRDIDVGPPAAHLAVRARTEVPADVAAHPKFRQVNYVITAVWGLGFLVMAMSDFILSRMPEVPTAIGVTANVKAMVGAVWFTRWYPHYRR